jgi:hypothetical protein
MQVDHYSDTNELIAENITLTPHLPDLPAGHYYLPHEQSLYSKKAELIKRIKEIRDRKTTLGGYKAAGKWFHSDPFSRSQHLGLVILGTNLPEIDWKTMDGTMLRLTQPIVQQVFISAVTQDSALFAYAESLINQVNTTENIDSIDINAGWPETYDGI